LLHTVSKKFVFLNSEIRFHKHEVFSSSFIRVRFLVAAPSLVLNECIVYLRLNLCDWCAT